MCPLILSINIALFDLKENLACNIDPLVESDMYKLRGLLYDFLRVYFEYFETRFPFFIVRPSS